MEKKPERKTEGKIETSENFRHIVRVANTDLDGKKKIGIALKKIRGISFMMINAVCTSAAIDPTNVAGELSDAELRKLDEIIKNPAAFAIPCWMFNRRGDYETGSDLHLIGNDLRFMQDNDVKRMRMIKTYKGLRLPFGLTVRGQRTRSNFRKNKGKVVGVMKSKVAKAAASESK